MEPLFVGRPGISCATDAEASHIAGDLQDSFANAQLVGNAWMPTNVRVSADMQARQDAACAINELSNDLHNLAVPNSEKLRLVDLVASEAPGSISVMNISGPIYVERVSLNTILGQVPIADVPLPMPVPYYPMQTYITPIPAVSVITERYTTYWNQHIAQPGHVYPRAVLEAPRGGVPVNSGVMPGTVGVWRGGVPVTPGAVQGALVVPRGGVPLGSGRVPQGGAHEWHRDERKWHY